MCIEQIQRRLLCRVVTKMGEPGAAETNIARTGNRRGRIRQDFLNLHRKLIPTGFDDHHVPVRRSIRKGCSHSAAQDRLNRHTKHPDLISPAVECKIRAVMAIITAG